jgi:hypothetical protein
MDDFDTEARFSQKGSVRVKERLPRTSNKFTKASDMFGGMDIGETLDLQDRIYGDYAKAMRMRDREPLEEESFRRHFFMGGSHEKSIAFGSMKDGYLLGSEVNDVFVPTHFAPSGLKQGYRLMKDLVDSDKPTALFITQDLADTVQKMEGWRVLPFKIKTRFRGEDVEKTLVVNRWRALQKLASHHVGAVIGELGKKAKRLVRKDRANASEIDEEMCASAFLKESTLEKIRNEVNVDGD